MKQNFDSISTQRFNNSVGCQTEPDYFKVKLEKVQEWVTKEINEYCPDENVLGTLELRFKRA